MIGSQTFQNIKRTLCQTQLKNFSRTKLSRSLPMADLPLAQADPELHAIIEKEKARQFGGIELIASENFCYGAPFEALGSALSNKYAEGYPGARYYGGNQYIDMVERLCQKRALEAYRLDPEQWGVNVQALSGSPANFAVYTALMKPGDKMMGLDLSQGGHLTHGFYTATRKVNASSIYFGSKMYHLDPATQLIDYDALHKSAQEFKPQLIIAGFSAYTRDLDYKKFREICDDVGAYLHSDMAHISGLVAAQEANDPFEYADVVTSTTHKSLRGPRSGIIFSKKPLDKEVDNAVFPTLQGGPHQHQIGALACQLKQVNTPEFRDYIKQVKANAKCLAEELMSKGHTLTSNGTDNHMLVWSLRDKGLTGSKYEKICDELHITLNKNTVSGDKSAVTPGGVRIGTPAVTTRGYLEADIREVAAYLDEACTLAQAIQKESGSKKLSDFVKVMKQDQRVKDLADDVQSFSRQFDIPGFDASTL